MIVLHQSATEENRQSAKTHLDEILLILARPGGYAKLSPQQRKFVVGITLAAIIPVDKRIRNVELERLTLLLKTSMQVTGSAALESIAVAEGQLDLQLPVQLLAKSLQDLLGIEDRCNLISNLWEIALCDNELHSHEEQMVYKVADLSGVPRKKVAELMARAAART
jgi:uncharacterized tellurite resistance protein B-like protein